MGKPRILAPAGDVSAFKAALLAGADEVYLGLPKFNARMNAANITERDLPELLLLAHRRRATVFLTTNILLAQSEIPELLDLAAGALEAGVDGFIVQDYGALRALRRAFPQAELHASTQMTTHNRGQVSFLARLGVRRVNLARELSIGQIELITAHAHSLGVETEVFVHGAYCISFSGQCTMSSFMGGLSANRGLCFQPCRRTYARGGARPGAFPAGDLEFPLSLKDNNALAHAEALAAAGVDSLKIEGRMKGPHYVYNVVSAWRNRIDNGTEDGDGAAGQADRRLGQVFNRGFSSGYLEGVISEEMRSDSPFDQSLVRIGTVERFSSDRMMLTVRPASFSARGRGTRTAPSRRTDCGLQPDSPTSMSGGSAWHRGSTDYGRCVDRSADQDPQQAGGPDSAGRRGCLAPPCAGSRPDRNGGRRAPLRAGFDLGDRVGNAGGSAQGALFRVR